MIYKDLIKSELEKSLARGELTCSRKLVVTDIWTLNMSKKILSTQNGPLANICSNEVGGCGCCHSEPKAMLKLSVIAAKQIFGPKVLILVTYAPCTNCANVILAAHSILQQRVRIQGIVSLYHTPHDPRGEEMLRRIFPVSVFDSMTENDHDNFAKWESAC